MKSQDKIGGLENVFKIIDNNLSKFYSSRPQAKQNLGCCKCQTAPTQKQYQINYYETQVKLIDQTCNLLSQQNRKDDEKMIANLLWLMIDYINKILELLRQSSLCECKAIAITESKVMKHKIQFMREQNQKFFRLYQQKNLQCQLLFKEIQQLKLKNQDTDLRPISTRHCQINNKQNVSASLALYRCTSGFSEKLSTKTSRISQVSHPINAQIKSVMQRDHDMYFKDERNKKQRKNKIFYEMD